METKIESSNTLVIKLKKIIQESIDSNNYNKALTAISFIGNYLYDYNQYYTDDDLEKYLSLISDKLKQEWQRTRYKDSSKKIVFYDGFGLDTRGVALMYLNALGLNGYDVTYITSTAMKGHIPTISNMCNKYSFCMCFINFDNYLDCTKQLTDIFEQIRPRAAFFYTTPYDSAGIAAFHMYENLVDRYLIDLTDHAFWLGKSACDFFLGSRDMSATLQYYYRGIPKEQMIKLGVNLLVEEVKDHSGLPFDPEHTEYIFSGGSLYKTLGDKDNRFYKIVSHILEKHESICFLYAGSGDDSEMKKVLEMYPNRAFLIDERKDFYYLIQNCLLYLNTFPMFGGMMMKYCGLAKKIPITLKHNNDSDGLLLNQQECKIEYESYEELIRDVDRLIDDPFYRAERESLLEGSVITEERFKNNIRGVIEEHKTDYQHNFVKLDTATFRREYLDRFNHDEQMQKMVNKKNIDLFIDFPMVFISGVPKKVIKKIRRCKKND